MQIIGMIGYAETLDVCVQLQQLYTENQTSILCHFEIDGPKT